MRFSDQPMAAIYDWLRDQSIGAVPGAQIEISVPDPDLAVAHYAGEIIAEEAQSLRARGLAAWLDLAECLDLCLLTPRAEEHPFVRLRFRVLDRADDLHEALPREPRERYGSKSPFTRIDKREDPWFLKTYRASLETVSLRSGDRVLFLGCGRGDEIDVLLRSRSDLVIEGIDWSSSATETASARFPRAHFSCEDLNERGAIRGRYHLVVAIGLLQSRALDDKALVSVLIQNHLESRAGLIIGWPNVRYLNGVARFGARSKNHADAELSLLVKDLAFYRKLLQKKGFKTSLEGKYDLFLTATRKADF